MARKLLRQAVTVATSLILIAVAVFAMASWRRSGDAEWCRKATTGAEVASDSDVLEQRRSSCAVQRQRQRVMFGSVWRTGGQAMAECGFQLAQLQLLADAEARRAILEPYGIDASGFDSGSRQDQDRFVQACSTGDRHKAG
jgi:hypothetical protein